MGGLPVDLGRHYWVRSSAALDAMSDVAIFYLMTASVHAEERGGRLTHILPTDAWM